MRVSTVLLAFLPFLAACGDTNVPPLDLGPDLSIPELRGNKVFAGAYSNLPGAATSDSQRVAFVGGLSDRILVVDPRTNTMSFIEVGQGVQGIAAAGTDLYYVQQTDTARYSLFRLRQNAPEYVTDNSAVRAVQWPSEGKVVVGSSNGGSVAFVAKPDSLMHYDAVTGAQEYVRRDCDQVVAMSPDGSAVLCFKRTTHTYVAYNLSTGGIRSDIVIPNDVATHAHEVRWMSSGLKVLYADVGRYQIFDENSGARTPLGDVIVAPNSLGVAQTAWSPEGTRIVFWENYCAQKSGDSCVKNQAFLMLYDLTLGGLRRVAIHNLPAGVKTGGAIVFSASGHDLYYVVGIELFVIPV